MIVCEGRRQSPLRAAGRRRMRLPGLDRPPREVVPRKIPVLSSEVVAAVGLNESSVQVVIVCLGHPDGLLGRQARADASRMEALVSAGVPFAVVRVVLESEFGELRAGKEVVGVVILGREEASAGQFDRLSVEQNGVPGIARRAVVSCNERFPVEQALRKVRSAERLASSSKNLAAQRVGNRIGPFSRASLHAVL